MKHVSESIMWLAIAAVCCCFIHSCKEAFISDDLKQIAISKNH